MYVFLTGATGFVGREVLRRLLEAQHRVRCLVRAGSEEKLIGSENVEIHVGDAAEPDTLEGALSGCDAVIHLVGIIREYPRRGITFEKLHVEATRNLVAAAEAQGSKRFLHMSANGTREGAPSPYHRSKWRAEEAVRKSSLDWTIFRPSIIFGPGDGFVGMLAQMLRRLPVMPVVGDGRYRMSPVAVQDVAASFVAALQKPGLQARTFHCCGPVSYSYNEVLDLIGAALGKKRVAKLHHPVVLMKPVVALLEGFSFFPLTGSQMTMLLEGNECDPREWAETFGIAPQPFPEGIRSYLASD